MADKKKSGLIAGFSLLALILLGEGLCFFVVDFDSVYQIIENEDQSTTTLVGKDQRDWIRSTAEQIHSTVLYDTGIWPGLRKFLLPPPPDPTKFLDNFGRDNVFPYLEGRLKVVNLALYLATYRIASLITWLPVLAVFFCPLLLDAYYTRKRKQYNFQYSSPTVQRIGIRTVVFLSISIMPLLLVSPLPIPPHAAPVLVLLVAFAIWAMVRNLPKRI